MDANCIQAEAAKCKKNLSWWTEEDKPKEPNGAGIDEWIFQDTGKSFGESWDKDWYKREYKSDYQRQIEAIEQENQRIYEEEYGLKDSLTPGAKQLNWKITSEFPLCPKEHSSTPLQDYLRNLKKEKYSAVMKYINLSYIKPKSPITATPLQ